MKKIYWFMFSILLPTFTFADPQGDAADFFEFHLPYSSAAWTSTVWFTGKKLMKNERQYFYKNGKMKITEKSMGWEQNHQVEVDLLTRNSFVEYFLPNRVGFNEAVTTGSNIYYIAPGSFKAQEKASLKKTGKTEKIDGVECDIYLVSPDPGLAEKSYYKEWRNPDGFVMKKEHHSSRPGFSSDWGEEVHGLKTNIPLEDSIFMVPHDVDIQPLSKRKIFVISYPTPTAVPGRGEKTH